MNSTETNVSPKPDGFDFAAAALIAILGTFIYYIHNYFKSTAVDFNVYSYFLIIVPILIVASLIIIFYFLIKGFSMEVGDSKKRKYLEEFASSIYLSAFVLTVIFLIFILSLLLFAKYSKLNIIFIIFVYCSIGILLITIIFNKYGTKIKQNVNEAIIKIPNWNFSYFSEKKCFWVLLFVVYILLGLYLYCNPQIIPTTSVQFAGLIVILIGSILFSYYILPKEDSHQLVSIVTLLILVFLFIWLVLIPPFSSLFLQGDVKIDMENIYYKTGAPIPVTIHLTGPNTGLSINLYKKNAENNLSQIDKIMLGPGHRDENISGEHSILIGNKFDPGNYIIFINTSNLNMTVGYYELVYERFIGDKHGKSFYLLNASEKPEV